MPSDEQLREREVIAYATGYDSRNAEVQALREALERIAQLDGPAVDVWLEADRIARAALAGEEATGG